MTIPMIAARSKVAPVPEPGANHNREFAGGRGSDCALEVSFDPLPSSGGNPALRPLLELSLSQTNSQGVYVYRLHADAQCLELVAFSGRPATDIDSFHVQLLSPAARWHRENQTALLLDRNAWADWRLERFPEFLHNRFPAAACIALVDAGQLVGIANVGRLQPLPYTLREGAFLRSLSLPLGALVSHSDTRRKLETEIEQLARKLADRKLLDRAKGVLQARHQWTEEQAYLHLRRSSRQRRIPMRQIAREVIDPALASGGEV
jgi:GAF domain-containing protein